MVVGEGSWEVCSEPYFHGRCGRFAPGSYNGLGGEFSGVIASVRQVGYDTGVPQAFVESSPVAIAPGAGPIVINPGTTPVVINPCAGSVVISSDPRPTAVVVPAAVVTAPTVIATVPIATVAVPPTVIATAPIATV